MKSWKPMSKESQNLNFIGFAPGWYIIQSGAFEVRQAAKIFRCAAVGARFGRAS